MRYALPLLLAAMIVEGQSSYIVRSTSDMREKGFREATVTVHGSNIHAAFRYAPDAAISYTTIISRDGGKTFIALNDPLQTWYRLDHSPFTVQSRLFSALPDRKDVRVRNLKTTIVEGESPTLLGRFTYETRDRLGGHPLKATYAVTAEVWADVAAPDDRWLAAVPFVAEIPAIDAEVQRTMSMANYFPRRVAVTIARQYVDGPPLKESIAFTVERLADAPAVSDAMFVVPPAYREERPVMLAPGVESH